LKRLIAFTLLLGLILPTHLWGQAKEVAGRLPKDKAGTVGQPLGKIAFIREGNLWIMDWDGKNQTKIVTVENAQGKPSWSLDGKSIAFVRSGTVDLKGPDNLGGKHKVYDIFLGYPDSAKNTTTWWYRLTKDLGSRFPEFSADGKTILYTKDLMANTVNAPAPNYQTCLMDADGGNVRVLRRDWQNTEYFTLMPTLGPNNMHAFVLMQNVKQLGVGVAPLDLPGLTASDVAQKVKLIPNVTAPAWSPDGNWIAYVNNDIQEQAILITNPQLTERYFVFRPVIGQTLQTYPPSWSPDSKWLTFAMGDGSIWIVNIMGDGLRQVSGPGKNEGPAWSKR